MRLDRHVHDLRQVREPRLVDLGLLRVRDDE